MNRHYEKGRFECIVIYEICHGLLSVYQIPKMLCAGVKHLLAGGGKEDFGGGEYLLC